MPDQVNVKVGGPYVESEDHRPNPTHQTGTLDTSGTAGAAHGQVEEVTPIFEVARKQDLLSAKRALDPDDDGVPESHVVLPPPDNEREKREKEVRSKTEDLDTTVVMGRATPAQRLAAETDEDAIERQEKSVKESERRTKDASKVTEERDTDPTSSGTGEVTEERDTDPTSSGTGEDTEERSKGDAKGEDDEPKGQSQGKTSEPKGQSKTTESKTESKGGDSGSKKGDSK